MPATSCWVDLGIALEPWWGPYIDDACNSGFLACPRQSSLRIFILVVRALATYWVHPSLLCHRCLYISLTASLNCHAITSLSLPTCCTPGNFMPLREQPASTQGLQRTCWNARSDASSLWLFHISAIIIADKPRQRALHSPLLHCICNALNITHLKGGPQPRSATTSPSDKSQPRIIVSSLSICLHHYFLELPCNFIISKRCFPESVLFLRWDTHVRVKFMKFTQIYIDWEWEFNIHNDTH